MLHAADLLSFAQAVTAQAVTDDTTVSSSAPTNGQSQGSGVVAILVIVAFAAVFGFAYWFNVRRKGLTLRDVTDHGPSDSLDL